MFTNIIFHYTSSSSTLIISIRLQLKPYIDGIPENIVAADSAYALTHSLVTPFPAAADPVETRLILRQLFVEYI